MQADHVHGWKKWYQNSLWGIDAGMCQDSGENTSAGVVEDPCHDDRQRHNRQHENGEVCEEGSEAGARSSPFARRQEVRQMPEGPQDTQEQGPPQRAIARLHAGQREAAPAGFLTQRPTHKEDGDIPQRIAYWQERRKTFKVRQRSRLDYDPKHDQRWNAQQDE